ncbi:hypothetical protein J7T55_006048 [Diaporthe amygdali]|uniref:uncharacterized protein n=1 Tax=Phomopsis amygdali TaxID=1214568 RepID=UPI0022FDCF77|nr:uncharacterized protein J7T55_006048 [Diaporthe amygdali]KAJ0124707.1 hypothetical protein J7T55_006048 [Diaporthe amygdali]
MAPQSRKLNKPLTCFYCNRKSSTRYDGSMSRFECHNCNATNHLDAIAIKKGDITDVPASKSSSVAEPAQFAIRRDLSPTSSRVFCDKCLQNQHLFISSLAQYFPEDPDDPEYAIREKGYYKFYKGLMTRYPQCCAQCEPKVREQLDKAAYTAKTDHLRRMLDRTAKIRVITTKSPLYYCHSVGKWLWFASLVFQLLWHVCLVSQGLAAQSNRTNDRSWLMLSARVVALFAGYLPPTNQLLKWSFWTSAVSIWWNPKWVDTFKSNTKHLVGFDNYYRYQALIFALKLAATLLVSQLSDLHGPRMAARATAHASMAVSMLYLYGTARKSIRVDHTPLWTSKANSIGATPAPLPPVAQTESRQNEEKSMATILDEILHEPTQNTQPQSESLMSQFSRTEELDRVPSISYKSSYDPASRPLTPNPFANLPSQRPQSSGVGLSSLSLSDTPRAWNQESVDYSPNMDWSPTQSKYRAFNTYKPGQSESRKFGETPTHEKAGAFWARVPPAPKTPAQRFLSQPNTTLLRRSPRLSQNTIAFQGTNESTFGQPQVDARPATIFAEPTFRPAPPRDERDDLLEKFSQSFKLESENILENTASEQRQGRENVPSPAKPQPSTLSALKQAFLLLVCSVFIAVLAGRAYKDFGYLWKLISIQGR